MSEFLPVAIVGMGGVFPASPTPAELWQHVLAARDTSREPPPGRWILPPEFVHEPGAVRPDRVPSCRACFVESIEVTLDGMNIDPNLVAQLDPVFQLSLAAGGQAWRSAVTSNLDRSRVGVILGAIALPTDATSALTRKVLGRTLFEKLGRPDWGAEEPWPHPLNRHVTGLPATILAQALDLAGTRFTLDAACASSLYAIKLAVDELQSGRADAMLAGGLSRPDSLFTQMGFAQLRAVSPSGRCSPFDVRADGLMVGEGAGIFVLKRLDDARRDGDRILGVIAGIGLSNDIGGGLLAPANEGQLRAMRAAYACAGWKPDEVGLIECHATGTPVGDAIEFESMKRLWEGHDAAARCVIGSVKSTVGHLLTGAGAAALAKVLFAVNEGVLPPTANHTTPAPTLALEASPFRVLGRPEPWNRRSGIPRRAAVSAFGFGGINAHLLIEETTDRPVVRGIRSKLIPIAIVSVASDVANETSASDRWWGVEGSDWFAREGEGTTAGRSRDVVKVPAGQFRIPPREIEEMLPQQALLLPVARQALLAAGLASDAHPDIGVFVGVALDLNTTNFHLRWITLRDAPEHADAAGPPLDANRTMGALASIAASRVAREFRLGGPSFTLSCDTASGLRALQCAASALERGELNAALVAAVDLPGDVREAINRNRAGKSGPTVDVAVAMVLKRLDDARRDGNAIHAVIRDLDTGTPFLERVQRDAGAASGLLAVAEGCSDLASRQRGGLTWLRNRVEGLRRVDVGVILEQADLIVNPGLATEELFVVEAADVAGLLAQLAALREMRRHDLPETSGTDGLAVCLLARDRPELHRLIDQVSEHLRRSPEAEISPSVARDRLFYAPVPLGPRGEIAFVYPASGNDFPGMGRDIALRFPQLVERQDHENDRLASQFANGRIWLDPPVTLTVQERIFAQVALGGLVSDSLEMLGVRPHASIGCSLGESSALFALRAWRGRDEMLSRMHGSTLFVSDLTGRQDAARTAWGLAEGEKVAWRTGIVERSPEQVREALAGLDRVYLQIIHTPRECVVGGQRSAVEELARRLGCPLLSVPETTTMHCAVVAPVATAYRDLHLLPMNAIDNVRFYSAGLGRVVPLESEAWADAILMQARATIDFPTVIEAAYRDGVRLFLEMGPGSSCTRIISTILAGRPHAARSACVAGTDGLAALWRVVALLAAHRVPVSLGKLRIPNEPPHEGGEILVPVGGVAFAPGPVRAATVRERESHRSLTVAARTGLSEPRPSGSGGDRPLPNGRGSDGATLDAALLTAQISRTAEVTAARTEAHAAYLRLTDSLRHSLADTLAAQTALFSAILEGQTAVVPSQPIALNRRACMEFAIGSIGRVLGSSFSAIDAYPTRVRLPDEPLMLVDRILTFEGEPLSLTHGRVVTEHDIHPGAWYLDNNRVPTCIAVESGQADLFLSGYLGIDLRTRGLAVYRLLDAGVTFHRGLPGPGETIHYDIHIDSFFRQGETHLFRFRFLGTVDGEPLLTMTDGIAGFFSAEALAAGKGVVHTEFQRQQRQGVEPDDRAILPVMAVESYSEVQVDALRHGDLAACFGPRFATLSLRQPMRLPGGKMRLVHRVSELDPRGGRFGIGRIRAEADIHPDDWFLTCHFVDDQVMPGTLMYECCLHTLRIFLVRLGWVGEQDEVACEPVPGITSRLKCRGQVIASTRTVTYEVTLKERGYRPEPYVLCDALMYADGKPVVDITDMTLRLTGLSREKVAALWQTKQPLFDRHHIIAFAVGKPSEAFGDRYRVFDEGRFIARLPADPYRFLDRIVALDAEPWQMVAGGKVDAEYDVPADAWYFAAERSGVMPFAVLLEAALQVCGWMSSYMGSALTSDSPLHYRNLGGKATLHRPVTPTSGTLRTHVETTRVSSSGGMIIQEFTFDLHDDAGVVYQGSTMFGFFSPRALAQQLGVRDATLYEPTAEERSRARAMAFPREMPYPDGTLGMLDRVDVFIPDGGPAGLGFIEGSKEVRADEWFFKAHFFQDPVWPGSLGLEALLQLMKVVAVERWGDRGRFICNVGTHYWQYRGQVLPTNRRVKVQASVVAVDEAAKRLTGEGYLMVDGLVIYRMSDFTLEMIEG